MSDVGRTARMLDTLRRAALEHWRLDPGYKSLDAGTLGRFVRRRRDCRSLARLGTPASEATALAGTLAERLGLDIPPSSAAERALALEVTSMLADIYGELIAAAGQGSGRK
jgi:hypothetical protein